MLNAKIKKAFKGFKILNKSKTTIVTEYKLVDSHDHILNLKINTCGNSPIIDFIESLGYWVEKYDYEREESSIRPKLVVLSIYDGGYCATLMEDDKITNLDNNTSCEAFRLIFGKYPAEVTLEELRKHYPEGTEIIICEDGTIEK